MDIPSIRLQGSKILVSPRKGKERTAGGLIIPVNVAAQLETGEVILIGDKVINVKVADIILYPAGAGVLQDFDGINYRFLSGPTAENEGDVWAIV